MYDIDVEILAPAGSYESIKAAINAGADAVYVGGSKFGARAYADNPQEDMLLEAIDYVHLHNKKIYLTVNTLLKSKELKNELYEYILPYYTRGLDAVIVQDLGVLKFVKENFPGLDIHASTQMVITGYDGAKLLEELGATRIVTARELSFEEIKEIRNNCNVEIESFVHGALCYCYSGQCLMSSMFGGRSGNRGRCAQPCRLPYDVKIKVEY
ncbi:MAG: U32 family peptidase [Lachnospiraceae bacterium]|nr:U32 family peptidase [Lachnospiraceae bacterium]